MSELQYWMDRAIRAEEDLAILNRSYDITVSDWYKMKNELANAVECINDVSDISLKHYGKDKCSGYVTIRIGEWRKLDD